MTSPFEPPVQRAVASATEEPEPSSESPLPAHPAPTPNQDATDFDSILIDEDTSEPPFWPVAPAAAVDPSPEPGPVPTCFNGDPTGAYHVSAR